MKQNLRPIALVAGWALDILIFLIVLRAFFSWEEPGSANKALKLLDYLTAPFFDFVRTRWPLNVGGYDLAPLVVVVGFLFLRIFLVVPFKRWCKKSTRDW